jgi:RNA polymerase-binding protein DksA
MAQKAFSKKTAPAPVTRKAATAKAARKTPAPAAPKRVIEPVKVKAKTKAISVAAAKAPPGKPAPLDAASKNGKKEKVPTNLSKSDLQYFRNLLLEKRREILGDVGSMESEAFKGGNNLSNMPIHMADVGTDNFEQEFTLGLIESERQFLRDIQEALIRVDEGTFGICLGTGKPIPRVRLEAVPWAKYTIEYSRLLESGKIARDSMSSGEEESGGGEDDEE